MLEPWEMMCKGLGKAWSGGEEEGKLRISLQQSV